MGFPVLLQLVGRLPELVGLSKFGALQMACVVSARSIVIADIRRIRLWSSVQMFHPLPPPAVFHAGPACPQLFHVLSAVTFLPGSSVSAAVPWGMRCTKPEFSIATRTLQEHFCSCMQRVQPASLPSLPCSSGGSAFLAGGTRYPTASR